MTLVNLGPTHVCFICRGESDGLAVCSPKQTPGWFCADCSPALAKKVYAMTRTKMTSLEARAFESASPRIGEYLEKKIGKTDMAAFTGDEWDGFLREVIIVFGEEMRAESKKLDPPF